MDVALSIHMPYAGLPSSVTATQNKADLLLCTGARSSGCLSPEGIQGEGGGGGGKGRTPP